MKLDEEAYSEPVFFRQADASKVSICCGGSGDQREGVYVGGSPEKKEEDTGEMVFAGMVVG